MRLPSLAIVASVAAIGALIAVQHLAEDYVLALVLVPLVLCIVSGLTLSILGGGWRLSSGWKEFLLFGALAPRPDNWTRRVAVGIPGQVLIVSGSVALGAILGIAWSLRH